MSNVATVHTINPEGRLPSVLAEFDVEVEARCQNLHAEAQNLEHSFRNKLLLELMHIPREIRKMPMKTFIEQHGSDPGIALLPPGATRQ